MSSVPGMKHKDTCTDFWTHKMADCPCGLEPIPERPNIEKLQRRIADLECAAIGFTCGQLAGIEKPFVGGCGEHVPAYDAYRCADCTASFHRECIGEHFELDDAVKNIRAKECWRKDCSEKVAELTRLTALLEDRQALAKELQSAFGRQFVKIHNPAGGDSAALPTYLYGELALELADRIRVYLKGVKS